MIRHRATPIFLYLMSLLLAHLFFRLVLGLEQRYDGWMGLYGAVIGLVGVTLGVYQREVADRLCRLRRREHKTEEGVI